MMRKSAKTNQPAAKKAASAAAPTEKVVTVALESDYAALVRRLERDFGVKVGAVPATNPVNPYLVDDAITKKALQAAGILTRAGNLSSRYK